MRINSILFFAFFAFFAFASIGQNSFAWFPVHPGIQYNYKVDSSAVPLSNVIKIDSISSGIYYLNKIVASCDTCINAHLANDPLDSTYVLNGQAQFLKHSFQISAPGTFYFKGSPSIVLKPFSALGSQWLFDSLHNITASVISRNVQNIFGISDSVCLIKLATNDTIVFSKNYGILQFPFKTIVSHKYLLIGIEGAATAGLKLKRFHDFFNFNAGDALQFAFTDTDYNILPPMFKNGHERWDFITVSNYSDSVVCKIKRTYFDSIKYGGSPPTITSYTVTENITFIDSLNHMANLYPLQEILVNPYFIYNNGMRSIHKIKTDIDNKSRIVKSFGENCPNTVLTTGNTGAAVETGIKNVYLNRNSSKIVGRKLVEGLGFSSELFNNYDRIYERCLIGYIKGSDTSGTIYTFLPERLSRSNSRISIYPNPANNAVAVNEKLSKGTQIKILNALGEEVQNHTIMNNNSFFNLNTTQLINGLYFIVISDHSSSDIKKLIIQH